MFYKLSLNKKIKKFNKNKDISEIRTKEFDLPLINAKHGNNGIMYYGRSKDWEYDSMCLDIVNDGAISTGDVYPQPQNTGVLYNAYLVKPYYNNITCEQLFYLAKVIENHIKYKYSYDNKATWDKVKKDLIVLPTMDKINPDYNFMDQYIKIIEKNFINKILSYLKDKELIQCELTNEEKNILLNYKNIKTKKIPIDTLFSVNSSKKKFNANTIKFGGKFPYVARGSNNNGIRGYITENQEYLNDENTISFGQDTATVYFQDNKYFTGDKIKVLSYKNGTLTPELALFYISSIRKSFQSFSWGQSSFSESVIKNTQIELPIKDNKTIDYDLMNKYIKIQEKLVIKKVINWLDEIINVNK